jgi:hypothetical protein
MGRVWAANGQQRPDFGVCCRGGRGLGTKRPAVSSGFLERMMGLEPTPSAWQRDPECHWFRLVPLPASLKPDSGVGGLQKAARESTSRQPSACRPLAATGDRSARADQGTFPTLAQAGSDSPGRSYDPCEGWVGSN